MRQRNIKNLQEKLELNSAYLIREPENCRGRWREVFGNDAPIYLEIGCGKGRFITGCAAAHPERNYIAIEGQSNVALRALEKAAALEQNNLRIVIAYVADLMAFFAEGELAGIYLNFSDPWPKARHAKRRLTYHKRLENYKQVLAGGGAIEFKTDNDQLFNFTLDEIARAGYEVLALSRDLHGETAGSAEVATGNAEAAAGEAASQFGEAANQLGEAASQLTEYEERFMQAGKNINYVKF